MDSSQSATALQPHCLHTNLFSLPFPPMLGDNDDEDSDESFQEYSDTSASDFETKPKIPYIIGKAIQRNDTVKSKTSIRGVDDFTIISQIGEGTYGKVYKAKDSQNNIFALKKIRLEHKNEGFPISAVRELKILKQLQHPNIVKLCEIITNKSDSMSSKPVKVGNAFYFVFEYMEHDLCGLIQSGLVYWTPENIAYVIRQVIDGLAFCHSKNLLHRDIKSANILMNKLGQVKVADFGLSRTYDSNDKERLYSNRVVSLYYRPPELLLGEEKYGPAVDVWSCGAILGELFTGKPIFKGQTEWSQFELISKLCGSPNATNWPEVTKLPYYESFKHKFEYPRVLRYKFAKLPPEALDLLDDMLVLNPQSRITMQQALQCKWLRNVHLMSPPILPTYQECHEMLWRNFPEIKSECEL